MSESAEQSALFAWASQVSLSYPALRLLYAIPNGGARNKITAAILKREGVRAGVPDICLPVPSGAYHALYIELKRTAQPGKPRGTLSEAQKWWLGFALTSGFIEQTLGVPGEHGVGSKAARLWTRVQLDQIRVALIKHLRTLRGPL